MDVVKVIIENDFRLAVLEKLIEDILQKNFGGLSGILSGALGFIIAFYFKNANN